MEAGDQAPRQLHETRGICFATQLNESTLICLLLFVQAVFEDRLCGCCQIDQAFTLPLVTRNQTHGNPQLDRISLWVICECQDIFGVVKLNVVFLGNV